MVDVQKSQKKKSRNLLLARFGEDKVSEMLIEKGCKVLARNFETPYGEIDLVAEDSNGLLFIEVKTRSSDTFGQPETAVNFRKVKHMKDSAQWYIQERADKEANWQIDVVAIVVNPKDWQQAKVEWFENAVN